MKMEHGTVRMYRKELRDRARGGPGPCEPCKRAQADYMSGYRLVHDRKRQTESEASRTRRKVLARLAVEYPERYQELMAEEEALSTLL